MADDVFINGRSAFHAGSAGKSMGAFPDACLCPPPPPGGPVPTPLPNNAVASDLTACAKSIGLQKNPGAHRKSYVAKSTGNEPADPKASGQAAIATHVIQGESYFQSHSMDVLFDNIEAVRHLESTTHNHASQALGSTPPAPMIGTKDFGQPWEESCGPECKLSSKEPNNCPEDPKGQKMTPHHIIPAHCFRKRGDSFTPEWPDYDYEKAACICVKGATKTSVDSAGKLLDHGRIHARLDVAEALAGLREGGSQKWTFEEAKTVGVAAVMRVLGPKCDPVCVAALVEATHKGDRGQPLRAYCPKAEDAEGRASAIALAKLLPIAPEQAVGI
jgi:hypothetical protein